MTNPFPPGRDAEMRRSVEETCAMAAVLVAQARASAAKAAALRRDAAGLRAEARDARSCRPRRSSAPLQPLECFSLQGVIEQRVVHAEWRDDRLVADPLLLERAHLLVGLGEEFLSPNAGPFVASLTGLPIVALLTLMRACDRVQIVDVVAPRGVTGPDLAGPVSSPRPACEPGSG